MSETKRKVIDEQLKGFVTGILFLNLNFNLKDALFILLLTYL